MYVIIPKVKKTCPSSFSYYMVELESNTKFHMLNYPVSLFLSTEFGVLPTSVPSITIWSLCLLVLSSLLTSCLLSLLRLPLPFSNLFFLGPIPPTQCPPSSFPWPSFHFFNQLSLKQANKQKITTSSLIMDPLLLLAMSDSNHIR